MTQPAAPQQQEPARKLNLRRLERLQRLLQYGAALVLLVFVALIALAWTELSDLNARKQKARDDLAKAVRELDEVNKELALKKTALDASQSANAVLSNIAGAYADEHPDKAAEVTKAVRNAVEQSIAQAAGTDGQPTQAAAQIPPRVYIQILHPGQRPRAAEVARLLQAKGFVVPGVENVERKADPQDYSDVRFDPADESAAGDVGDIRAVLLGNFGVKLRETRLRSSGAARPRHYELWLGDDFAAPDRPGRAGAGLGVGPLVARPDRRDVSTDADRKNNDQKNTDRKTPDQKNTNRPRRSTP